MKCINSCCLNNLKIPLHNHRGITSRTTKIKIL
nr:MAG TPA: hypothetical protein [Caudoviricetes sp.]